MSAEDELLAGDLKLLSAALFLGHYTQQDLERALEERGFWERLAQRGFPRARVELVPTDASPRLVLRAGDAADHELGELRAQRAVRDGRPAIIVDWLEMRHPGATFTPDRPRLPGQRAPGLGLGRALLELLVAAAARVGAELILVRPQHYHNAVLYGHLGFRFADAGTQARFESLARRLAARPLAEASWDVEEGRVREEGGKPVEWADYAGDMVLELGDGRLSGRPASR